MAKFSLKKITVKVNHDIFLLEVQYIEYVAKIPESNHKYGRYLREAK